MTRKPRTPESAVLRACLQYLALRGIEAWRNNSGASVLSDKKGKKRIVRFGKKGSSDILGVIPGSGKLLAVECKASDGEISPDQEAFLERVRQSGGVAIVARSLDDLIEGLKEAA